MPTIIDELVTVFTLDTKGLDAGQQRVLDSIKKLEDSAKRGGQSVERQSESVVTFFRALENPLAAFRSHMEKLATATLTPQRGLGDLAAQARRTGTSVESGALAGASGLRALGMAGLGAIAVVTSLQKVMENTLQTQRKVFAAGVGAAGAGLPIQSYTAISQALFTRENVPENETQAWLTAYTQAKERAAQGDYGQAIALNRQLAIAGVEGVDVFTTSPAQAMVAIARRFGQMTPQQAQAAGSEIGMTDTLAFGLRNAGQTPGGLQPMIDAARQRAISAEDQRLARQRLTAENDLNISIAKLQRVVADDLTPGIVSLDKILREITDYLTGHATVRGVVGSAAIAAGGPFGATIAAIVSGIAGLFGHSGNSSGAPGDTRNWWQRHAPSWLGGRPGPQSSLAPPAGGTISAPASLRAALASAGMNETAIDGALGAMYAESGLSPTKIAAGGDTGIAQWVGPRKAALYAYARAHNLDPLSMEAQTGFIAQEISSNPRYRKMVQRMNAAGSRTEAGKIFGYEFEQNRANPALFGGGQTQQSLDQFHSKYADRFYHPVATNDYLAWARRGGITNTSNDNSTSHTVHVNTINVHTKADTATGIGAAALMAAKGADLVTQSNSGFQ